MSDLPGPHQTAEPVVVLYGTSWCAGTQLIRRYLRRIEAAFTEKDIETTPGAEEELRALNNGTANHPAVLIDGQLYAEPPLEKLKELLG